MTGGASDRPWRTAERQTGGGGAACVIVRFRLTPKSSKDSIDGFELTAGGPAFKARVRAVPEDGEANAALERLAAEWLQVPKSSVSLTGGAKSRVKTLSIGGDTGTIEDRLMAKLAAANQTKDQKP